MKCGPLRKVWRSLSRRTLWPFHRQAEGEETIKSKSNSTYPPAQFTAQKFVHQVHASPKNALMGDACLQEGKAHPFREAANRHRTYRKGPQWGWKPILPPQARSQQKDACQHHQACSNAGASTA